MTEVGQAGDLSFAEAYRNEKKELKDTLCQEIVCPFSKCLGERIAELYYNSNLNYQGFAAQEKDYPLVQSFRETLEPEISEEIEAILEDLSIQRNFIAFGIVVDAKSKIFEKSPNILKVLEEQKPIKREFWGMSNSDIKRSLQLSVDEESKIVIGLPMDFSLMKPCNRDGKVLGLSLQAIHSYINTRHSIIENRYPVEVECCKSNSVIAI